MKLSKPLPDETVTKLCKGCRNDFYNGVNNLGIKECWFLKNAKPVTRYEIGTWTLPTQPGAFRKVEVYDCYQTDGKIGVSHYDKLPDCAKEVKDGS